MSKEVIPSFPRAILGKNICTEKYPCSHFTQVFYYHHSSKQKLKIWQRGVSMSTRACFCYAHESIFMFVSKPMPWSPKLCFMNWSWELSFPLEFILTEDILAQDTWPFFFSKVHKKKKKICCHCCPFLLAGTEALWRVWGTEVPTNKKQTAI